MFCRRYNGLLPTNRKDCLMDAHVKTFIEACDQNIIPYHLSFFSLDNKRATYYKGGHYLYRSPCVYFLFREENLVYIGSTECLPFRMSAHISNRIIKFDSAMAVMFHQFGIHLNEIRHAEDKAIRHFRPILNRMNNPDWKKQGRSWVYLPDLIKRTA